MPFTNLEFADDLKTVKVVAFSKKWEIALADYSVRDLGVPPASSALEGQSVETYLGVQVFGRSEARDSVRGRQSQRHVVGAAHVHTVRGIRHLVLSLQRQLSEVAVKALYRHHR